MSERTRNFILVLALAVCAGCGGATGDSADAAILQRLNYESGNLRQWSQVQALPGRVSVVRTPVRQGRFAARFVVRPGDDPINSSGERAEVAAATGEVEGTTSWWAWSTLFPGAFRATGRWNVFTQWHHTGTTCPPPVSFEVDASVQPARLVLHVRGGAFDPVTCHPAAERRWSFAPLRRGRWYDIRFHVRWSANPAVGLVALRVNGRQVVRATRIATLYPGQAVYVKQGYYRSPAGFSTFVLHDAMRRYRP
jgi:hypothetical protein